MPAGRSPGAGSSQRRVPAGPGGRYALAPDRTRAAADPAPGDGPVAMRLAHPSPAATSPDRSGPPASPADRPRRQASQPRALASPSDRPRPAACPADLTGPTGPPARPRPGTSPADPSGPASPADPQPGLADPPGLATSLSARPGPGTCPAGLASPVGSRGPRADLPGWPGAEPGRLGWSCSRAVRPGPADVDLTRLSGWTGWPEQAAPQQNALRSGTESSHSPPHRPTRRPAGPSHPGRTARAGRRRAALVQPARPGPPARRFQPGRRVRPARRARGAMRAVAAHRAGAGHADRVPRRASQPRLRLPSSPSPATATRPGPADRGRLRPPMVPGHPRLGHNAAGRRG